MSFFRLSLRAQADGEGIPFQAVFPDDVGEVLAVDRPGGDLPVSSAPPGLDDGTAWGILRQGRKDEQIAGPLIVLHNQSIVRLLRRKLRIQQSFRGRHLFSFPEAQLCQPGGLFRQFLLDEFLFRQLLFHGLCRSRQCAEHQQHRHDKTQKSLHTLPSLQKSAGKSRRDRTSRYPYAPVPHRSRGALGARSWPTFWLVFSGGFASTCAPPSQFPSDRIAPKGHRLNTYSNGVCSGLGPDFLITAPARKGAARVGDAMQLMLFHRPKKLGLPRLIIP